MNAISTKDTVETARPARRARPLPVRHPLLIPILPVCLMTLAWQAISATFFPPVLFPTPVMVTKAFVKELAAGRLVTDILASLGRILSGFKLGCTIGAATGLLMGFVPA